MSEQPPMNVSGAAERLMVSEDTIRKWVDDGLLRAWRLPSGHRRIDPASVERFREEMLAPAGGAG
jgi:excisionase family DNA binding protein